MPFPFPLSLSSHQQPIPSLPFALLCLHICHSAFTLPFCLLLIATPGPRSQLTCPTLPDLLACLLALFALPLHNLGFPRAPISPRPEHDYQCRSTAPSRRSPSLYCRVRLRPFSSKSTTLELSTFPLSPPTLPLLYSSRALVAIDQFRSFPAPFTTYPPISLLAPEELKHITSTARVPLTSHHQRACPLLLLLLLLQRPANSTLHMSSP